MKAITQHRYGGPDTYEQHGDCPMPEVGPGDVLIRVRAASVNAADWLLMHGEPLLVRLAFGLRAPRVAIRGRDAAGVVEGVGSAVRNFAVGDEVYLESNAGTFAEYTVAPETAVAKKPTTLSFDAAATVPLAGTTALQGLRDVARVKPGDRVLINGASGGVGTFAVQIAHTLGAEVTGVCSARNVDLVRSLGADHVIDYTTDDFVDDSTRYDVIFDLVGNRKLGEYRRALTPRGTLVLASGAGGRVLGPVGRILAASLLSLFVRHKLRPLAATTKVADLDALRELIDAGTLRPTIERTYPLDECAAALRHFGEQHTRGKIAISV